MEFINCAISIAVRYFASFLRNFALSNMQISYL